MLLTRREMLATSAAALASAPALAAPKGSLAAARAVQETLICLDTHLDAPMNFARPGWDIMQRHSFDTDLSQVDYPRMVQGGLSGGFFAIYTPQGPLTAEGYAAARDAALLRATEIREMVARNHDHFELAFTPADAPRIKAAKKRIVYQSIENAWPLGTDVTLLKTFYDTGARMTGVAHFQNNQFGDSATDPKGKMWSGLSPLGRDLVKQANALGMVLDASHSSDDVFDQLITLSHSPIILSHSGCRAVHDHPRNIDDARLKTLAETGGSVQINSFSSYLVTTPENPEREKAMGAIFGKLHTIAKMTPADAAAAVAQAARDMKALDKTYPVPRATFEDVMAHLRHALDLVGPDHVGIGLDWDGGGGVTGMEDCSQIPKITERLIQWGYKEADLAKIWGGNALRILDKAEEMRTATE
jgi:membrane dipeptidase